MKNTNSIDQDNFEDQENYGMEQNKDIDEDAENESSADLNENISKDETVSECPNCAEYKSGWARAQADYINLQKQIEQNRSELVRISEQQILEEFIPVYDNFKKSMDTPAENETQIANWKKGIEYIMKQFEDILKGYGVEPIQTIGAEFNPEFHEALGEEESDEKSGTIVREIESGFTMKGKVIKPAKVITSK